MSPWAFPYEHPWFKQNKECLWFFLDQGQGVSDRGILTQQTQIQLAHMGHPDEVMGYMPMPSLVLCFMRGAVLMILNRLSHESKEMENIGITSITFQQNL